MKKPMKKEKPLTVLEIINEIGKTDPDFPNSQPSALAAVRLGVHQTTVETWLRAEFIPLWHWEKIIELSKNLFSPQDLFEA
jgi:hypothetical protein